ncbi:MAG: phosphotransferase family protein [Acidimicrobiales bacterium]
MSETQQPERPHLHRSSRDPEQLGGSLEQWLATQLPDAAAPRLTALQSTSDNGMSSDTVLFDAAWEEGAETHAERLVARIAPSPGDVPVFPSYDLRRQFETIRLVGELTTVPVPRVWWFEPDPAIVGSEFFVMSRVDGDVPPDVMPYDFGDNWLFDAPAAAQRRLQDSTVGVLAELHAIEEPEPRFGYLAHDTPGADALRRHVAHTRQWYEFAAADGGRSPLLDRGFAWLDDHWPRQPGPTVLSWGDARIGNVLYRDFEPVAVLDWEMAGLGPPELDVAWLINAHRTFEDLAAEYGLPGMPDFLRADDVCATYEAGTGYAPRNLAFYGTYAALQWGVVFLRTGRRQIHFGEREAPADPTELLHNRRSIERMLAGEYWADS